MAARGMVEQAENCLPIGNPACLCLLSVRICISVAKSACLPDSALACHPLTDLSSCCWPMPTTSAAQWPQPVCHNPATASAPLQTNLLPEAAACFSRTSVASASSEFLLPTLKHWCQWISTASLGLRKPCPHYQGLPKRSCKATINFQALLPCMPHFICVCGLNKYYYYYPCLIYSYHDRNLYWVLTALSWKDMLHFVGIFDIVPILL